MGNGLTRLRVAVLRRRGDTWRSCVRRSGAALDAARGAGAGPGHRRPRRHRLGGRDPHRAGGAGLALSPDALTGMEANHRFVGPETMETKIFGRLCRLAELDLHPPERVGPGGRAAPLRHGTQGRLRPEAGVSDDDQHVHRLHARRSRTTSTCAGDRKLQRALESWQPNFLNWWETMGPAAADRGRLPAHRGQRRPRGLGALRPRRDGRVPLGHLPRRARPRPPHRLRRAQGRAGVAAGARRVPRRPAAADRHPGRHRAGVGRAAAPPRRHRAVAVRPAQPLPGQRRGGPSPLGDGLPAARLLRPRRARGGRGAAAAQLRRASTRRASSARSTRRRRTGCRSSCSPTSPTGTASTSSAR